MTLSLIFIPKSLQIKVHILHKYVTKPPDLPEKPCRHPQSATTSKILTLDWLVRNYISLYCLSPLLFLHFSVDIEVSKIQLVQLLNLALGHFLKNLKLEKRFWLFFSFKFWFQFFWLFYQLFWTENSLLWKKNGQICWQSVPPFLVKENLRRITHNIKLLIQRRMHFSKLVDYVKWQGLYLNCGSNCTLKNLHHVSKRWQHFGLWPSEHFLVHTKYF